MGRAMIVPTSGIERDGVERNLQLRAGW